MSDETTPPLTITLEDDPAFRWVFGPENPIKIGRSPENDIFLDHPELSRCHCTLFFADGVWNCSDLSRNGVFQSGKPVKHVVVTDGLLLQLSRSGPRLRFTLGKPEPVPPAEPIDDPVTHWLDEVRGGRNTAARMLWDHYFARVVQLARRRLGNMPRRASDEEDVASGAMASLLLGIREDRFGNLADRYELWKLLVVLTNRNAADQVNAQRRLKRGGGLVRGDSVFDSRFDLAGGFDLLPGDEPTPEFLAAMAEETERLLTALNDESLQAIALWKLEGWSNQEVAEELGCSLRTVERRLQEIRTCWSNHGAESPT